MSKLVIFGASGFVGKALTPLLDARKTPYEAQSSKKIDLSDTASVHGISAAIGDGDTVVMLSAYTPEKGPAADMTVKNIQMVQHLLQGAKERNIAQLIYISSDAIYPLTADVIDETTIPRPDTLYGYAHLVREKMLQDSIPAEKLTILRPCAIYGHGDTHNAYGIMRFIRSAQEKGAITLFGGGEEYRDHIHVDDLAAIILEAHLQKITGAFNIASGKSWRFSEIAALIQSSLDKKITITYKPRAMPIFHRHANITKLCTAFPSHRPRSVDAGIKQLLKP